MKQPRHEQATLSRRWICIQMEVFDVLNSEEIPQIKITRGQGHRRLFHQIKFNPDRERGGPRLELVHPRSQEGRGHEHRSMTYGRYIAV